MNFILRVFVLKMIQDVKLCKTGTLQKISLKSIWYVFGRAQRLKDICVI